MFKKDSDSASSVEYGRIPININFDLVMKLEENSGDDQLQQFLHRDNECLDQISWQFIK